MRLWIRKSSETSYRTGRNDVFLALGDPPVSLPVARLSANTAPGGVCGQTLPKTRAFSQVWNSKARETSYRAARKAFFGPWSLPAPSGHRFPSAVWLLGARPLTKKNRLRCCSTFLLAINSDGSSPFFFESGRTSHRAYRTHVFRLLVVSRRPGVISDRMGGVISNRKDGVISDRNLRTRQQNGFTKNGYCGGASRSDSNPPQ